ncbi:MAG: leucine-rich repeat protein [Bacteroidales bacterium]|nr:leucine-rich repeat protein [Bacteroidales bacterium]
MKKNLIFLLVAMFAASTYAQVSAVDSLRLETLKAYGQAVADEVQLLDSVGLSTMSEQLASFADTIKVDESDSASVEDGIAKYQALLQEATANKQAFDQFPAMISENDSLVKLSAFPPVAEDLGKLYANALETAKQLLENKAQATWNSYIQYGDTLKAQKHNWHIHAEDPGQWKFSLNTTIDNNFVVALDTTRKIAQIKQIRGSLRKVDTIPSYIPFQGKLHAPVILGDGNSSGLYTNNSKKDSLKVVKLPNTLKVIENNAFRDCAQMDSLVIPPYTSTIGANVFQGCEELTELTIEAKVPPVLKSSLHKVAVVYVPENGGDAYWRSSYWGDCAVVPGDGIRLTVDLKEPGTLGKLILEKVPYLRDVNYLKIKGDLNTEDVQILGRLKGMISIDMAELDLATLPEKMFYQRTALKMVVMPLYVDNLTIRTQAFYQCSNLSNIQFPQKVETLTIGTGAFYQCSNLGKIQFPREVESLTIEKAAFEQCSNLSNIQFPQKVKTLVLEGSYADLGAAFGQCTNLSNVQFPQEVEILSISSFSGCHNLSNIQFPQKVKRLGIGYGAFSGCRNLSNIQFPLKVEDFYLARSFDYCTNLSNIQFPEEVGTLTIARTSFHYSNLSNIQFPQKVGTLIIEDHVFGGCSNLINIQFPREVESLTIEEGAFKGCSKLTEITFPVGLRSLGINVFDGCTNLKKVVCNRLLPSIIPSGSSFGAPDECALYVPSWTLNDYKLAAGWTEFYPILPMETMPEKLVVDKNYTLELPEQVPANYHPDMSIDPSVSLHIAGDANWHLDDFVMFYAPNYYDVETTSQLLNESVLDADSVTLKLYMDDYRWVFISIPFDAAVKDIVINDPKVNWVIRRYAGENRAEHLFDQTWVDVSIDDTLYAGNGYIWQCSEGSYDEYEDYYYDHIFDIPAIKNDHLNGIFANGNVKYTLQAYPSEFLNNQGWNLVGNPYPSYYDSRAMRFEAPITVWGTNGYVAYSLKDDAYILKPGEAFFVQCPPMDNTLEFRSEGRQLDNTVRVSADYLAKVGTRAAADRKLFNLILSDGEQSDRARVVINPKASASYEMHCDAAKFMSGDNAVLQCYTLSEGVQYAINEMPMPTEDALGFAAYFPAKSDYSISLDTKVEDLSIVLFDKKLGIQTDLSTSSYHFTADAGYDMSRFTLFFQAKQVNKPTQMEEASVVNVDVFAHASGLSVKAPQSVLVQVYAVDGCLLQTAEGAQHTFNLPAGTYMVKVQQKVYKVTIL